MPHCAVLVLAVRRLTTFNRIYEGMVKDWLIQFFLERPPVILMLQHNLNLWIGLVPTYGFSLSMFISRNPVTIVNDLIATIEWSIPDESVWLSLLWSTIESMKTNCSLNFYKRWPLQVSRQGEWPKPSLPASSKSDIGKSYYWV